MDDPLGARALTGSPIPDALDATLVLVRHGESTFITEGRFQGQADLVAARLAARAGSPALPIPDGPPLEVAHSPLGRATETATATRWPGTASLPPSTHGACWSATTGCSRSPS